VSFKDGKCAKVAHGGCQNTTNSFQTMEECEKGAGLIVYLKNIKEAALYGFCISKILRNTI
jgi:hypothetical protein